MPTNSRIRCNYAAASLILLICITNTGCIGTLANLFYVLKGHEIPAEYAEFKEQRVAVVVNTKASAYGPDELADTLERFITMKLATNVPDIQIVPEVEIANWFDINGTDSSRLAEMGKSVQADFVLSINLDDYTIREGSTIYKGKSEITIAVVDCKSGNTTYAVGPDLMEYPRDGRPAIQTNDRKFETFYLAWLSEQIAQQFYKHDANKNFADDAALNL